MVWEALGLSAKPEEAPSKGTSPGLPTALSLAAWLCGRLQQPTARQRLWHHISSGLLPAVGERDLAWGKGLGEGRGGGGSLFAVFRDLDLYIFQTVQMSPYVDEQFLGCRDWAGFASSIYAAWPCPAVQYFHFE